MDLTNKETNSKSELKSFEDHESSLKQLLDRVAQDLHGKDVDIEIFDNNKISDALTEFIEPYSYDIENDEGFLKLLNIATLAWNLSFFSKQVARNEIEQILQEDLFVPADTSEEFKEDLKNILGQLIARKKRHFASYKRLILDFELKDEGDDYRLFVISTPVKKRFK
jgi:hypothetical protein